MRTGRHKLILALVMLVLFAVAGCRVLKGGQKGCGCPSKKGMVGY